LKSPLEPACRTSRDIEVKQERSIFSRLYGQTLISREEIEKIDKDGRDAECVKQSARSKECFNRMSIFDKEV
jgi:hypothetical protein